LGIEALFAAPVTAIVLFLHCGDIFDRGLA
jgi:hypothetical protein